MGKKRLNKGRFLLVAAMTVGVIVGMDAIRRNFSQYDNKIEIDGSFPSSSDSIPAEGENAFIMGNTTEPYVQPTTEQSQVGYTLLDVPSAQLSSGLIALIDDAHPMTVQEDNESLVSLNDEKNEFYSLRYEDISMTGDAAAAFNVMMQDYHANTGLSDFVVYNTTSSDTNAYSPCPGYFPESALGNTVDLAVQGYAGGIIAYDGRDEEGWIVDNCASYGFIVRFPSGKEASTGHSGCPWHLRYVGTLYSAIMRDNNLCLEEFNEWIKSYTLDTAPYEYNLNGIIYKIYYCPSMGDSTQVKVPVTGRYTISGNNADGFVITAIK